MDAKIKDVLERVMKDIVSKYTPEKIILFGSYASGIYTKDSDIDLLIVIKEAQRFKLRHKLLNTFSIPIQLVFISDEEFKETKDVIGGIAYPASKYGEVIYEES